MGLLPGVLWINGCRGWIAFWLTAPLFLLLFALMAIPWIPIVLINLVYRLLTCQGFSIGRDVFNMLFPIAEVFIGLMFAKNPLCPRGITANIGKWYMSVLGILAGSIGRCMDCLRKRKAKRDGGTGDVPAPDPWVQETKVSEQITTVDAGFKEIIDLPAQMTVIRYSNYVIFMNPVFAPVDVYKKHGKGAERVILWLPTAFHHMAADLCLAAFPNAEIWGCQEAGSRHSPALAVKDPNTVALNCAGVRTASLAGTCYDERWLFFEPEGHLCVGDLLPGLTETLDVPQWLDACSTALTCGGKQYMLSYQRTFVINHSEVIAELEKVLSWDLKGLSGCHSTDLEGTPESRMINYWGWLLPSGYSYQPHKDGAVQLMEAGSS